MPKANKINRNLEVLCSSCFLDFIATIDDFYFGNDWADRLLWAELYGEKGENKRIVQPSRSTT